MIIINTGKDIYTYDPSSQRVFRNQTFIPRSEIEPVYSGSDDEGNPEFIGLFLKGKGTVITLGGKEKTLTNIESI